MRTGNLQRKPNHCSHRKEWATAMRRRTTGAAEAPIRGRGKLFALTDPIDLNAPIGVMDLKIADGHRGGAAADGGGTVRQARSETGTVRLQRAFSSPISASVSAVLSRARLATAGGGGREKHRLTPGRDWRTTDPA